MHACKFPHRNQGKFFHFLILSLYETQRQSHINPFLLAHRRGAALTGIGLVGLGLCDTLGKDLGVLVLWRGIS